MTRHDKYGPPFSPPKRTIVLEGIPEAVPGPNAFAQQALRVDRQRLESSSAFQHEQAKRQAAPLATIHPAFRRECSPPSSPQPDGSDERYRDSAMTTVSPFINAGRQLSPDMKLIPSGTHFSEPTARGYIEERREQRVHQVSGSDEDRTPVYHRTPQNALNELVQASSSQKLQVKKEVTITEPPKSPKKSFFEKFRKPNSRSSASSSPAISVAVLKTPETATEYVHGTLPPKAKAILGSPTPVQESVTRSPSKRKGFFSSSRSKYAENQNVNPTAASSWGRPSAGPEDYDEQPRTSSTQANTPQTGYSEPIYYDGRLEQKYAQARGQVYTDHHEKSQSQTASTHNKTLQTGYSDPGRYNNSGFSYKYPPMQATLHESASQGQPPNKAHGVVRSQSLKYFDHSIPPTPPAKNTPPDQKVGQDPLADTSARNSQHDYDATPSRLPEGIISTHDSLSPARFGSSGMREAPTLVTKRSIYSMHASVVPEMSKISKFEETRARVDPLNLEGFSLPDESKHATISELVYSPSVYAGKSEDGHSRPPEVRSTSVKDPAMFDHPYHNQPRARASSSTSGMLPVCYPEVGYDATTEKIPRPRPRQHGESRDLNLPLHGHTQAQARDHSSTPPLARPNSHLFSSHADESSPELDQYFNSPSSYKHSSAKPSPLQYLPATVYTLPPKTATGSRRPILETPSRKDGVNDGKGLGIYSSGHARSLSLSHNINPLQTAPVLPAPKNSLDRVSPGTSVSYLIDLDDEDMDPLKTDSSTPTQGIDKLDQILAMLGTLGGSQNPRAEEVSTMREQMRITNERLETMEQQLNASPPTTPTEAHFQDDRARKREQIRSLRAHQKRIATDHKRIATQVAYDFYQSAKSDDVHSPVLSVEEAQRTIQKKIIDSVATTDISPTASPCNMADANTIARLEGDNRRLMEMVQGFGAKLAEMEKKMGS